MAKEVKIELNKAGLFELMYSAEITSQLEELGSAAMSQLGEGYEMTTFHGRTRANVGIRAATNEAWRDQLDNNTIAKAVFGS